MLNTPLLFLVFNRPNTTAKVFDVIRQVQPVRLFIAADGPRPGKEGEAELCKEVREFILNGINWNCEVQTLFRDENLGCGKAVSGAISWFFEHVEEGIILEDDCLPDNSFFPFCAELLEKYRTEEKVMSISGSNLLGYPWKVEGQSYFWGIGGIWGWATWKRAWKLYDFKMEKWGDKSTKVQIRKAIQTEEWFQFYYPMFEATYIGSLDTWDIQWLYSVFINGGLSINPEVNLVKNLGFGESSSHTKDLNDPIAKLSKGSIKFPLNHPNHREVDTRYLNLMLKAITRKHLNHLSLFERVLNKIRKKIGTLKVVK